MNSFSHVPPGFRFHPTDEELVDYYLRKKIASKRIDLDVIKDVDLYKIEPWDLQELCRIGTEEQNEWYFFSHKDKKYPTGTRTNRATKAGFWKATGRDKAIYSKHSLIGMRKTLVFYKGRAPNGQKSDWIMHEYRLETNENGTPQEEGWVVCRVFKKKMTAVQKIGGYESSPCNWYDDQLSLMASELETSPRRIVSHQPYSVASYAQPNPNLHCKQEFELAAAAHYNQLVHHHHHDPLFFQLPQLESPKKIQQSNNNCSFAINVPYQASNNNNASTTNLQSSTLAQEGIQQGQQNFNLIYGNTAKEQTVDQVTDWRVLDKFVASQLSNDEAAANVCKDDQINLMESESKRTPEMDQEYAVVSASTSSSCQIDLWK